MPRLLGEIGKLTPAFAVFLFLTPIAESVEPADNQILEVNLLAQSTPQIENRQVSGTEKLLNSIEQYNLDPLMSQVGSVEQLRDVLPQDWAYEALRSLIQRYGCISGFPSLTYGGNRPVSRYEFAAALNSCLDRIEKLIASSGNLRLQEDLDTLLRLMQEFQTDLAILQGKTDGSQARIADLEATQFSTTTKLIGEVVFGTGSILAGDGEKNPVLGHRTRLELATSFSGQDLLFTRLSGGNFPTFAETTDTFAGDLAFAEPTENDLSLEVLFYSFNIGSNTEVIFGATGTSADDIANTVNILDGDGGTGAISTFGTRNPIYLPPGDAGLGIIHRPLDVIEISAGYLASPADEPTPGSGLFNGSFSALGQVLFTPTSNLSFAATYVHSYNQSDTGTGSNLANLRFLTANLFTEAVSTVSDSYGAELSWAISDRLVIGGWGTLSKVTSLSTLGAQLDRGTQDIWNWAATLALPDLGKEGNLAGLIIGAEPMVSDSSIDTLGEDRDRSLHLEAFYQYQINDNLAITPGVVWITAPDNNNQNDDLVIGTIRTTFSF